MEALLDWMAANPQVWAWFTTAVRFLFPVLALLILIRTIRSCLLYTSPSPRDRG